MMRKRVRVLAGTVEGAALSKAPGAASNGPNGDGKGAGAAEALRQAQAFVRGHEKWKHPYNWAAWVVWGVD